MKWVCMWSTEVYVGCFPQWLTTLFFKQHSLINMELGGPVFSTPAAFYVKAGNLNSSSHASIAGTLSTASLAPAWIVLWLTPTPPPITAEAPAGSGCAPPCLSLSCAQQLCWILPWRFRWRFPQMPCLCSFPGQKYVVSSGLSHSPNPYGIVCPAPCIFSSQCN